MALAFRPVIAELAQDVIATWLYRATGLKTWLAESGLPRPSLPFIGFEFPVGRSNATTKTVRNFSETIGTTTITITAAEGAYCAVRINAASVALEREVGETLAAFAERLRVELVYWLRGRATVALVGDTVVVTPLAAGLLFEASAFEGAMISSEVGGAAEITERIYHANCKIEIMGARLRGALPGASGDGLDAYTIETACVEGLSDKTTIQLLRGAYLVPLATPIELVASGSVVSGARREVRATFDLVFGWTGFFAGESSAIESLELALFTPNADPDLEEQGVIAFP